MLQKRDHEKTMLTGVFIIKIPVSKKTLRLNFPYLKNNYEYFKNFGGDMETLLLYTKISHGMRIFGKQPKNRKIIIFEDINSGFNLFKTKKEKEDNTYLNYYI